MYLRHSLSLWKPARRRAAVLLLVFVVGLLAVQPSLVLSDESGATAADCPKCPQCKDCAPVEAEHAACLANAAQLSTSKEQLSSAEAAIRSELETTKQIVETCNLSQRRLEESKAAQEQTIQILQQRVASAEEAKDAAEERARSGSDSCQALEAERDTLQASRRELAASLEQSESREAQLQKASKEFEAQIETLSKSTEGVVSAKLALEEKLKSQTDALSSAVASKKKTEQRAATLKDEVDALKELLKKAHASEAALLDELSNKSQQEYLFSFPQLVATGKKFYTFMRGTLTFSTSSVYNAVLSQVPQETKASIGRMWTEHTGRLQSSWREDYQPKFDSTMRSLSSNDFTRTTRRLYSEKVNPRLSLWLEQAKEHVSQRAVLCAAYISVYLDMANDKVGELFVSPLTERFPELKPLIPKEILDRVCLVAFATLLTSLVVRQARLALRIALFAAALAIPCCWCRMCRRRTKKGGKRSAPSQAKAKRPRKSFTPAAAAGNAAGTTKGGGAKELKENAPPHHRRGGGGGGAAK